MWLCIEPNTRCLSLCKDTDFKANHNSSPFGFSDPPDVCLCAKVRIFGLTAAWRRWFLCGFRRGTAGYVGMFFILTAVVLLSCCAVWVCGYGVVSFCWGPFGLPLVVFWRLFCRFLRGVGRLFVSVWLTVFCVVDAACVVGVACRVVVVGVFGRRSWAAVVSLPVL